MSKPQSKSSQAQKSAAKASQSTSKSAHEVLENLIADNQARQDLIELLQEENDKLAYTIGSRDLEIHDLQEQVADLNKDFTLLSKALQDLGKYNGQLEAENQRLITIHNQLGRDYMTLSSKNDELRIDSSKKDLEIRIRQKVIQDIKQMLSLQQQIMSDVAGLK